MNVTKLCRTSECPFIKSFSLLISVDQPIATARIQILKSIFSLQFLIELPRFADTSNWRGFFNKLLAKNVKTAHIEA